MFATYPSLAGRGVLVSGGASGIGADLVRQFCEQGALVAFVDRDDAAARASITELTQAGHHPRFRSSDVSDLPGSLRAMDELADEIGGVSVLINNAGDDARHEVLDVTPDLWDRQMAVNLRHQFFLAQRMVARLPAGTSGSIVNMGSISWMKGARDVIVYATAKAAVVGMTKSMSREFGRLGVRANAIAPGWVATPKQLERAEAERPGAFQAAVDAQAIPEPLQPADVSRLALWLAADDSKMCTGQTIVMDGGAV